MSQEEKGQQGTAPSGGKVTFRIILTSERTQPFRVISIAEEAPLTAALRFAAEEFGITSVDSMAATTKDGTGINPAQTAGSVFMKRRDPRELCVAETVNEGGVLSSLVGSRDVATTFWIPDPARNEIGLLEAMHRRTTANRTNMLVHSRPRVELQFNFSTHTGDNIDISHPVFHLPKASVALLQMEHHFSGGNGDKLQGGVAAGYASTSDTMAQHHASDGSSNLNQGGDTVFDKGMRHSVGRQEKTCVLGSAFREKLRMGMSYINDEEYYLVRYRDYSAWAVKQYSEVAKRDHFWGKAYIEQCFAVHVGKGPGELIPITEAQFIFGVEILHREFLERTGMAKTQGTACFALTKDQFCSLGVVLSDGMRAVGVEGEEMRRRLAEEREEEERKRWREGRDRSDVYIPPSIWDWRPSAIKKRLSHQLQLQYQFIGRLVVRCALFGIIAYVGWSYLRIVWPSTKGLDSNGVGRHRQYRRGGRISKSYASGPDDDIPFTSRGLLQSVVLGPKEVFDYLLSPAR